MPPTPTVVYETAKVITHDNVQKFQLIGSCTDEGALFDKHLFLLEIVDGNDATSDTFKHLCTIADSDEYKKSRDAAVQAGDTYWRSNSFTVLFTDVDVAAAAKTALNDRIDLLATGYATYLANFYDAGTSYSFPTGTVTALTALIEAYYTAWKEYDTKKHAYGDAIVIEDRFNTDFVNAQNRLNALYEWGNPTEDRMKHLYDEMNAASGALNTIVPQALSAADAMKAFIDEFNKGAYTLQIFAIAYDKTLATYTEETLEARSAAANDMTLLPAAGPVIDDAYYFGADEQFYKLRVKIGTAGLRAAPWDLKWEYWQGAGWDALEGVEDGTWLFKSPPGWCEVLYSMPSNWVKTTLCETEAFWLRARIIDAGAGAYTQPKGNEAEVITSQDGASAASHLSLDDDLEILEDAKNALLQDREMALLAVTAAAAGVANHLFRQGEMTTLIGEYTTDKNTAQNALTDATSDKLKAETEKTDKYTALTDAYNEVRAVQSDWVPDAWFPYPP